MSLAAPSKADQAYNAVIAHPGLTSLRLVELLPGLGPQVKAAGILHELLMQGRIDRRSGKDLWEWWPRPGAQPVAPVEIDDGPEEEESAPRVVPRGKRAKRGFRVVDRLAAIAIQNPGLNATTLGGMMTPPIDANASGSLMRQAVAEKLIDRVMVSGVWRYYAPGQAPLAERQPILPRTDICAHATPAEAARADIVAPAALAKVEPIWDFATKAAARTPTPEIKVVIPESPPPAPVTGPRTVAGFVIEDKPVERAPTGRYVQVAEAMRALEVSQSFLLPGTTVNAREQLFIRAKKTIKGRKFVSKTEGDALRIGRIG